MDKVKFEKEAKKSVDDVIAKIDKLQAKIECIKGDIASQAGFMTQSVSPLRKIPSR